MKGSHIRLGILTSVDVRHRFVVNRLRKEFDVAAIGYEQTGYAPAVISQEGLSVDEKRIVDHHFSERFKQERVFFGSDAEFATDGSECCVRQIDPGELNTQETLQLLDRAKVDIVAVYGTNLIKSPLLEPWSGRMINLHLGLSPYYRGTATNFYPLFNDELQYVGATIHLLDSGIDSGPILRHARPRIVAQDMPHTIGCKAILAGVDALIHVLHDLQQGRLQPVPQWSVDRPRLYLRKDYHPRQVVQLYRQLEQGMIPRYVDRASELASQVRLVE